MIVTILDIKTAMERINGTEWGSIIPRKLKNVKKKELTILHLPEWSSNSTKYFVLPSGKTINVRPFSQLTYEFDCDYTEIFDWVVSQSERLPSVEEVLKSWAGYYLAEVVFAHPDDKKPCSVRFNDFATTTTPAGDNRFSLISDWIELSVPGDDQVKAHRELLVMARETRKFPWYSVTEMCRERKQKRVATAKDVLITKHGFSMKDLEDLPDYDILDLLN